MIFLYILLPYFALLKNKAKKKHPEIFAKIEQGMKKQFEIEKDSNVCIDKYADSTAEMLGFIFSFDEGENAKLHYDFGYQLGRVVYFLDAFDDYEKDLKSNSFNPFKNSENFKDEAAMSIRLSNGALTEIMKEIDFNKTSAIIDNIIYDGLNYQLERIIDKYRGEKNDKSL